MTCQLADLLKMILSSHHRLDVNLLPGYTFWPEKLLSFSSGEFHSKNWTEVYREYETEKWGSLLDLMNDADLNIDKVDLALYKDVGLMPFSFDDEIYLIPPILGRKLLFLSIVNEIELISKKVPKIFNAPIVDLGCGPGTTLIKLGLDERFKNNSFYAFDFSPSSLLIVEKLAALNSVYVVCSPFDFTNLKDIGAIPLNSLIYASFALAYLKNISQDFWKLLLSRNPLAIILIEPIVDFFDGNDLLSLLRKKYMEVNDYCPSLYSSILLAEAEGILKIAGIKKNYLGPNVLCPQSIITLIPVDTQ